MLKFSRRLLSQLHFKTPPRNILLVAKPNTSSEEYICTIGKFLRTTYDCELLLQDSQNLRDLFGEFDKTRFIHPHDLQSLSKVDLCISSGGDGTVLYLNHLFQHLVPPPVLSFSKGGSLAFLMPHEADSYKEIIHRVFSNQSTVTNRMRLEGTFKSQSIRIMNEISIHRGNSLVPLTLTISISDEKLVSLRGDGLICSTPTGSTGYSLSAGGTMVHPLMNCILITPVSPKSMGFRPLILPSFARVSVSVQSGEFPAVVSYDGLKSHHIEGDENIEISKCNTPFTTIDRDDSLNDWMKDLKRAHLIQ